MWSKKPSINLECPLWARGVVDMTSKLVKDELYNPIS